MRIRLKYHRQNTNFSCGPAALKMIFGHFGKTFSEDELIKMCDALPKIGTTTERMVEVVGSCGFLCETGENGKIEDLIEFLRIGKHAIVNYFNPVSKCGHFGVISGVYAREELIGLTDPQNGEHFTLPFDEFEKVWHDNDKKLWGWWMVVGR